MSRIERVCRFLDRLIDYAIRIMVWFIVIAYTVAVIKGWRWSWSELGVVCLCTFLLGFLHGRGHYGGGWRKRDHEG